MRIAIIVFVLFANARVGITNRRLTKEIHEITWDPKVTKELSGGQIYHIDVRMSEYMDIFCPQYDADAPKTNMLKFIIYNVSVKSFRACSLTDEAVKIFDCNTPNISRKLTTKFQRRSPNPLGFVFKPDSDYYYIAFIDEEKQGCDNAMRMHIKVHHRDHVHGHTKAPSHHNTPQLPDVKPTPIKSSYSTKARKTTTKTTTTMKPIATRAQTEKKEHQVGDPSVGGSGSPGAASSPRCSFLWILVFCVMAIIRN